MSRHEFLKVGCGGDPQIVLDIVGLVSLILESRRKGSPLDGSQIQFRIVKNAEVEEWSILGLDRHDQGDEWDLCLD